MRLFRPVGVAELAWIAAHGWTAFPPRLEHQPIFYPVLNFEYARAIAQNWNTKDPNSGFAGFVTEFDVDDQFVARYEIRIVGSRDDQELWVPADEVDTFNEHILGNIVVTGIYYGVGFHEKVDPVSRLPESVLAQSR